MSYESSKAHFLNYCQYFPKGGTTNRVCKIGVNFEEVRDGGQYPCIVSYGCTKKCQGFEPRLEADAHAYASRVQAKMELMREWAINNCCIHCGTTVARRVKVGGCIYLEPCGHRLGQGEA